MRGDRAGCPALELDAIYCLVCSTPIGDAGVATNGKAESVNHNSNDSTALNTLDFVKTSKNESISLKVAFTTEFGIGIGGTAFAAMVNGRAALEKLKTNRTQVQGDPSTEIQQLSLLGEKMQQIIEVEAHEEPTTHLQGLNHDALIDVMRMVDAAIYGFITREQAELMTIDRSTDESYEIMLDALLVAIKHIQNL